MDSVDVALGRVNGSTCRWLDSKGKLGSPKSCEDPSFVRAQGGSRWSARMRLRGRGTWRVVSRAKQKETGLVERTTTPQNTRTFRLR